MKSRFYRPFAISFASLWFALPVLSQTSGQDNKTDYSKEASVVERMDIRYDYAADGTGSRDITAVIDVHTGAAVARSWCR